MNMLSDFKLIIRCKIIKYCAFSPSIQNYVTQKAEKELKAKKRWKKIILLLKKAIRIYRKTDHSTSFYYQFIQIYRKQNSSSRKPTFDHLDHFDQPQIKYQIYDDNTHCLSEDEDNASHYNNKH